MSLKTDEINTVIERVQKQLSGYNSSLELICMTHKTGARTLACMNLRKGYMGEDISLSLNKLIGVWAKEEANDSRSEFLGTIETQKSGFAGLFKKKLYLNIIALNTDTYKTAEELELDLYRLSWHACNSLKNMMYNGGGERDRILIPNPKGIKLLVNNLQADIFASLLYSLIHRKNYVSLLGKMRTRFITSDMAKQEPEAYPFIMTLDQTEYLCNQLLNKRKLTSNPIEQVWAAAKLIIKTISHQKLETWQQFAKYSQEMVWRGIPPEIIISIAIDRNDDIETKKLGVQVSGLTGIKPLSTDESIGYYNPYKTDIENAEIHASLTDELFENLITRAIFENSASPFLEKADEQNMKLRKGQFLGWCAIALQDAADVFERSIKAKQPPTQTTREVFKNGLQKMPWMRLKILGEEISKLRREKKDISHDEFISFLDKNYQHKYAAASVSRSYNKHKQEIKLETSSLENSMTSMEDEIYGPNIPQSNYATTATRH